MKLIVLTGKARSGKTHALKLIKKVNDNLGFRRQQIYFQDDVRYEGLDDFGLTLLEKQPLGIISTNDSRVLNTVDDDNIFYLSKEDGRFYVSTYYLNQGEKLDWTGAFNWLKSNSVGTELTASTTEEKPEIVDEFFSYICK